MFFNLVSKKWVPRVFRHCIGPLSSKPNFSKSELLYKCISSLQLHIFNNSSINWCIPTKILLVLTRKHDIIGRVHMYQIDFLKWQKNVRTEVPQRDVRPLNKSTYSTRQIQIYPVSFFGYYTTIRTSQHMRWAKFQVLALTHTLQVCRAGMLIWCKT